jgi:FkbM family methyltransferase
VARRQHHIDTAWGGFWVLDAPRDCIVLTMLDGRVYDAPVFEALRPFLRPGACAVDLGANFGQYAVLMARALGEGGKVVAVEANPDVAAALARTVADQGLAGVVEVHARAAGARSGDWVAFPEPDFRLYNTFGAYGLAPEPSPGCHWVRTLAVDDLDIDRPVCLVKVDVQGYDLFALRGAERTLRRHRCPVLFEVEGDLAARWGHAEGDYLDFVRAAGYRVERVLRAGGINYLCVPDDRGKTS